MTRTAAEILAEGDEVQARLLEAVRAGDEPGTRACHDRLNELSHEIMDAI